MLSSCKRFGVRKTLLAYKCYLPHHFNTILNRLNFHFACTELFASAQNRPKILGYDRIYFYHIQKTAGESLNNAFRELTDTENNIKEDAKLPRNRTFFVKNGRIYVFHNRHLIQQGFYFYAASHVPSHQIKISPNTFRITLFRDPVARIISYYRMINHWEINDIFHPSRPRLRNYIRGGFSYFINNIPKCELKAQLFMFSRRYDVNEAIDNLSNLNFIMLTEKFGEHLRVLSSSLGVNLKEFFEHSGYGAVKITDDDIDRLREILHDEYLLLEGVSQRIGLINTIK